MENQAYSVAYDRENYHAPIVSENKEATLLAREQEIKDNLIRYVGEYRLGVKFDQFNYDTQIDKVTGEQFLTSANQGRVRDIFRKSIKERESKGQSTRREVAECLGFEKLEKELLQRPTGDMAVWVSPPGTKEEGYGEYSFTFLGQSIFDEGKKKIRMIPYRNTFTKEQHNEYLSQITGKEVDFKLDSQFLANPIFIEQNSELQTPEDILRKIGESEEINTDWYEDFTEKAWPLIQGFLYLVRENVTDEELGKALNALENFAIAYKEDNSISIATDNIWENNGEFFDPFDQIGGFIDMWGEKEAPVVLGSCGIGGNNEAIIDPVTPGQFQQNYNKPESGYGSCPEIKCGGTVDGEPCGWVANEYDAYLISIGRMNSCPRCFWKPK